MSLTSWMFHNYYVRLPTLELFFYCINRLLLSVLSQLLCMELCIFWCLSPIYKEIPNTIKKQKKYFIKLETKKDILNLAFAIILTISISITAILIFQSVPITPENKKTMRLFKWKTQNTIWLLDIITIQLF